MKDPYYTFQVNVPHSEYGACDYFAPKEIEVWLKERNLHAEYCGGGSWGNGFTNGITNKESTYMVRETQEFDGLAFKLHFPKCKVHVPQTWEEE